MNVTVYLHHVRYGNAFGDADDEFDPGIGRFENSVGSEWGGDKYHGGVGAGFLNRVTYGVEYGNFSQHGLAAFAGGDPTDYLGAIPHALFGVKLSLASSNSLDDQSCLFVN